MIRFFLIFVCLLAQIYLFRPLSLPF
jgi:hypothetical protein